VLCADPIGKGVGLVVPSLLTWPGSAIVHDIKGENWQLTAGFRSRHGRVLLFDPTNPKSSAYNPLLEVRRGEWEVRDVQNIADVLVDPEGSLDKRNHWEKTSHALLVGAILHVLYAEDGQDAWPASPLSCPIRSSRSRRRSGDDEDRTSARQGRIPSSPSPRASCSTNPTTNARACSPPPCRSSVSTATLSWPR
jgi:type IV secretion system protein VirD4